MLEFRLKNIKEITGLINDLNHDENMISINIKKDKNYYVLTIEFKQEGFEDVEL